MLDFKEEFSSTQVNKWIRTFNLTSALRLEVFEELPCLWFNLRLQICIPDLHATKTRLLEASPLGAGTVFASVNDYTLTFDPCSQVDFKHLVFVNILQRSPALFGIIQFLTASIGR